MKAFKGPRAEKKRRKRKERKQVRGKASEDARAWDFCAGLIFTFIATQEAKEKGGRGPERGGCHG